MICKIDNEKIDLGNTVIEITKQAYDFSDLSKRYIDRTNRFSIPFSQINKLRFKNPGLINSTNDSFEVFYNATLEDQNVFLLNGVGILQESNLDYKLQLIDYSKIFFDALNKSLRELDFESSNFTFGAAAYATLKVPTTSVWIWPVCSMHEKNLAKNTPYATPTANLDFSRPFFSVQKIVEKIFEVNNWTLNISEDLGRFGRAIASANHSKFYVTDYQKTIDTTYNIVGDDDLDGFTTYDFKQTDVAVTTTTINIKQHEAALRIRGNISVDADFTIVVSCVSGPLGTDEQHKTFYIKSTDTYLDITTNEFTTTEANNYISVKIYGTGTFIFDNVYLYTIIEESTLGDFKDGLLDGFRVKAYDNLPDIKQIDFLKNIWIMFGAAFNTDSFTRTLDVFSFKNLSKMDSVDWSNRLIQDSHTITTNYGDYAQVNNLLFDNDEVAGDIVGNSFFEIANETLEEEKDIIKLIWSASKETTINGYPMLDMPVYSDTVRIAECNPRIGTYYYDDSNLAVVAQFAELDWQVLKTDFYELIFEALNRLRFIECEMMLSRYDFVSFNFKKTVYIDYWKSYFLVLRISDFIPGNPCKVQLLKIY